MPGYYARNPHEDTSDIDVDQADADEAAERHDEFLRTLVRDEYNLAARGARTLFDHEVRAARDLPIVEFAAAYSRADKKFTETIVSARNAMPARLAHLRAHLETEPV